MSWVLLVIAGLLEVCWAVGLKYTEGFTRLGPSIFTLVTLALSMYLLARATQVLAIGTAYGVWVGIGAFGTALLGVALLNEPVTLPKVFFLVLLLVAIAGLKLTTKAQ